MTHGPLPSRSQKEEFARRYADHLGELERLHRSGESGAGLVRRNSDAMDGMLRAILEPLHGDDMKDLAVLALGSYGRRELSPRSDLDLLFVQHGAGPHETGEGTQAVVQGLLYFLWDLGLEIGHAVRTVDECVDVASRDNRARTALLDHRLIVGDPAVLHDFQSALRDRIFADPGPFIREKTRDMEAGREKYGDSVYMLEPHVKEGAGGLRDLNVLDWSLKVFRPFEGLGGQANGIAQADEIDRLARAQDFILRVRNDLHFTSGSKNDRLTFDHQERIALSMGYRDRANRLGVEQFMRDYYLSASEIQHLVERILHRILDRLSPPTPARADSVGAHWFVADGKLRLTSAAVPAEQPLTMIETFAQASSRGVEVDPETLAHVQSNLDKIDGSYLSRPEVWRHFFSLLRGGEETARLLLQMNESGFLGALIPEFGALRCQAQHDAYHVYTTDVHTLHAVGQWKRLRGGGFGRDFPILTSWARNLGDDLVLTLGLLFHDIGKGSGKGHSHRGALMTRDIANRMGLGRADVETLVFIVEHHLLLSNAAYKRDTDDPDLIRRLAELIQSEDRLALLYLLTFSDTRAVGPRTWTQWKGTLLQELVIKVGEVINPTDYRDEKQRLKARMEEIVNRLRGRVSEEAVLDELKAVPPSYLMANPPWKVARHVEILQQVRERGFVATVRRLKKKHLIELLVCTTDAPALLAKHAGTLTSYGLNILKVQVNTTPDGRVLDLYHVEDPVGDFYEELDRWEALREDLRKAGSGEFDVKAAVRRRMETAARAERYLPPVRPQVNVDNEASARDTMVEIVAQDRLGLLYDVTMELSEFGANIRLAKISTEGEKAIDVFYVQDRAGRKFESAEIVDRIRRELLATIAKPL